MKKNNTHEGCIEQMYRLFADKVYGKDGVVRDENRLVRMDDLEMREEVQSEIAEKWDKVTTENLYEMTDLEGFKKEFMQLHGFDWEGVDYSADMDPRG
jgi:enoyl-[acyl-carrier protein] reductase/trans-2-enoyl-CoA reductase (NAD+)